MAVATALYPMLSRFQELGQQRLRAVWQIVDDTDLDRIIFDFDVRSLIVSAVHDNDTVNFEFADETNVDKSDGVEVSKLSPWKDFVGVSFGWGWVTVNQQGYCDGLLLSFGGIVPQIVLTVMASSIEVGRVGDISRS